MSKQLSIIIPHYRETFAQTLPILASIATQVNIDFALMEVIVVTDGGGNKLTDEELHTFPWVPVTQICLEENVGPGGARQVGLERSSGDYVMFCDSDDVLHSVAVLDAMLQEIQKTGADILTSNWVEEIETLTQNVYVTHEYDRTWMHGKMFRRFYLMEHQIRFHPDFRIHEDSYFLTIAGSYTDRIRHLPIPTYVWKYGSDTITRRRGAIYTFASMPIYVEVMDTAFAYLIAHSAEHLLPVNIAHLLCYLYFTLNQPHWLEQGVRAYLVETNHEIEKRLVKYFPYFDSLPKEEYVAIYQDESRKAPQGVVPDVSFREWVDSFRGGQDGDD